MTKPPKVLDFRKLDVPQTPINMDKISTNAGKYWEAPAFECDDCRDTGYILNTRLGPGKVYGRAKHMITYSYRCSCQDRSKPWRLPTKPHDEIPI